MQQLQIPPLAEGEIYIGAISDTAGDVHHIILLPGDNDDATFEAQLEWAKSIGGDLPTRIEQAMLWANHRDQFKKDWYWSNESHHSVSGYAWCQRFASGYQFLHKGNELRARAVRRLPIYSFSHFKDFPMTTITLEHIKAEHSRLADLIASFEAQEASEFHFPETLIALQTGEHYAGLIIGKDDEPSYHLVLLPGDENDIACEAAWKWAQAKGGNLPTRREQSLLYANLKDQFEPRAYWSCEAHDSDSGYAWFQDFTSGFQFLCHKINGLRARAVRRLVIE